MAWVLTDSTPNREVFSNGHKTVTYEGPKGWVARSGRGQYKDGFATRQSAQRRADGWVK